MRFTGRQTSRKPIAVSVITTHRPPRGNGGRPAGFGTPGGIIKESPCAEWCGDVGSQAVRLVLRTSQRTSPRSSRPLTPRALRCCFRSRHRIKPAHGLWLKARAPLGRHQWPAFANRLVECQSTCPRGRHGERRSWNAASNLSAEPRWIRVLVANDPGDKSIVEVTTEYCTAVPAG